MSAIAGVICFGSRRPTHDMLERIVGPLAPFGREGVDTWTGGSVALARLLTRFLPEDDYDQQPMHCAEQQLTCVFIGRLENRQDIEAALGLGPEQRRTSSDGAVAFEAWKRWGEEALDRLHGAFTLAVWDERAHRLVCARSPTGGLPLHWDCGEG